MNREFQVVYRQRIEGSAPMFGAPLILNGMIAESADDVRAALANTEFQLLTVTPVRPVVDWTKPNFDRDEAAAFLGIEGGTLTQNKGSGHIPFSESNGRVVYVRAWLEEMLVRNANPIGKKIAAELDGQ